MAIGIRLRAMDRQSNPPSSNSSGLQRPQYPTGLNYKKPGEVATELPCEERAVKSRQPCKVCRQIRVYLIFAIPLIFMSFFGIEVDWPEDINMTAMVGNLFLGAFCLLVAWRVYVDYFRKK
jgi:hypothetical protein